MGKISVLNNLQGSSCAFGEMEEIQKDLGLVSGLMMFLKNTPKKV